MDTHNYLINNCHIRKEIGLFSCGCEYLINYFANLANILPSQLWLSLLSCCRLSWLTAYLDTHNYLINNCHIRKEIGLLSCGAYLDTHNYLINNCHICKEIGLLSCGGEYLINYFANLAIILPSQLWLSLLSVLVVLLPSILVDARQIWIELPDILPKQLWVSLLLSTETIMGVLVATTETIMGVLVATETIMGVLVANYGCPCCLGVLVATCCYLVAHGCPCCPAGRPLSDWSAHAFYENAAKPSLKS